MECFKSEHLQELLKLLKENTKLEKIVKDYSFYFISNSFEINPNQEIISNLKESKVLVMKQYKEKDSFFIVISFKQTLMIVNQNSFDLLPKFFSTNPNTPLYFFHDDKKVLNIAKNFEKRLIEFDDIFIKEMTNFNRYLSNKFLSNNSIDKLWFMIQPCIAGYLIKESYLKALENQKFRLNEFDQIERLRSIEEWDKNEFIILRSLGDGSSFDSRLIYHIEKKELFVIKESKEKPQNQSNTHKMIEREINNYMGIKYPLLPDFYGITINNGIKCPIIQFIYGRTLDKIDISLSFDEKVSIIFEIMMIINYLHKNKFVYRDLNPNNLIIDDNKNVFLIDFDRMLKLDQISEDHEFTFNFFHSYIAPEALFGELSFTNDIYSIGMMIYYFFNKNDQCLDSFNQNSELYRIYKMCIEKDAEKRPSISELMNLFYINFSSHFKSQIIQRDKDVQRIKDKTSRENNSIENINQISYKNLPFDYETNIKCINNDLITRIYSQFDFYYFDFSLFSNEKLNESQKTIEDSLFQFLTSEKFITFQLYNEEGNISLEVDENNVYINDNSSITKLNITFCVEKRCFVFESLDKNFLISQLNKTKSILLNSTKKMALHSKEVIEFCSRFKGLINKNKFVSNSIYSICCYLIRRYYQPSIYFKDKSFFIFNSNNDKVNELNIKSNLFYLFQSNDFEMKEINEQIIKKQIKSELNEQLKQKNDFKLNEFNENEFIKLRCLYSSSGKMISLAIHIPTLYLFAIKNVDDSDNEKEITFCQNYSHRCFTHFYGFIKNNQRKVIGFVYEFMCNGSLDNYIKSNKNDCDDIFSITSLMRIFQGIYYLQSNSLIHRDLKPLNFLVNNDNQIYFSDFETIRKIIPETESEKYTNCIETAYYSSPEQLKGEKIDFQADIYSVGLIIYFLFEKKEYFNQLKNSMIYNAKKTALPKIINSSRIIQDFYQKCVQYYPKKRAILNDIQKVILFETKFKYFFQKFFISEKNYQNKFIDVIDYFYEKLYFLNHCSMNEKVDSYLQKIFLFTSIISIIKMRNPNEKGFIELPKISINDVVHTGNLYYNGELYAQNYSSSRKLFKLVETDSNALLQLGNIYYYGYGVELNFDNMRRGIGYYINSEYKGNTGASLQLGYYFYYKQEYRNSLLNFQRSLITHPSESSLMLGRIYFEKKDYQRALNYFEISAENYNSQAFLYLGLIYCNGYGIIKDFKKAKRYFEISGLLNNSEAIFNLGELYYKGNGVEKNILKAIEYFELSAKYKNPNAILKLGYIFWIDESMHQEVEKSIRYFKRFIQINDRNNYFNGSQIIALNEIGLIYLIGNIKHHYKMAMKYIQEAANYGFPVAENNLGLIYLLYEKKANHAVEMFKKSSGHNYALADVNLGQYYENIGNMEEAVKYYLKAIDKENIPIIYKGKKLYDRGIEKSKKYIMAFVIFKLFIYYLEQNDIHEAVYYFVRFFIKMKECSDLFDYILMKPIGSEFSPRFSLVLFYFKYALYSILNFKANINYVNNVSSILHKMNYIFISTKYDKEFNYDFKMKVDKSNENKINSIYFYQNNNQFPHLENDIDGNDLFIKEQSEYDIMNFLKTSSFFPEILDMCKSKEGVNHLLKMKEDNENMMKILYQYPYPILFGRLNASPHPVKKGENIDESFYSGFGIKNHIIK